MKDINTEELRKHLANYSPEDDTNKQHQEQELRSTALAKAIAALSELSQTIETSTNRLTALAAELRTAHFSVTLPDEDKAALRQCCEDAANSAAESFKTKTKPLLKEIEKVEHRVSLPATAAYILFVIFFWLVIFFAIVLYANCQLWHSTEVRQFVWGTLVGAVVSVVLVVFLTQKHWL